MALLQIASGLDRIVDISLRPSASSGLRTELARGSFGCRRLLVDEVELELLLGSSSADLGSFNKSKVVSLQ